MTTVLPAVLALFTAASAATPPGPAKAPAAKAPAGEVLAVVDVEAADTLIGLAAQVTRAVLETAAAQNLTVLAPDDIRARLVPKQYEDLRRCGGTAVCAAQFLDGMGASRAVLGRLSRGEKHYLLRLWLVDLKARTVIADVDRPILIAARRFQKDVAQAVPPLLRGEREARGTLVLTSNVDNTQVFVDGDFVGLAPITLELKVGKHEVRVERRKYLSITRLVAVEANQKTEEPMKLLLKPGEIPDEQVIPGLVARPPADAAPQPLRLSPWTWACGGVALAGAGTGLFFGLKARSGERDLLAGYDAATGVYQGTRREALAVQRDATVANVSYAVGAAAAAATVVFVVFDALATGTHEVQVAPTAGPGGAGVLVGGRF